MKKCIALLAMVAIFFGIGAVTVSAEEYKVVKGDNLWSIAQEYETTIEDLVEMNGLKTTVIQPKQILVVDDIYIVEKEDTLTSVSEEFDVTVEELKEWNDLTYNWIRTGQELQVYDTPDKVEEKTAAKPEAKKQAKQEKQVKEAQPVSTTSEKPEGKTISVEATAYTAACDGCSGVTYTGVDLNSDRNAKVIAVDPSVIPLGTKVYVEGYGYATADDIGGAIKGNRIDLHVPTKDEAYSWGRRTVNVTILD